MEMVVLKMLFIASVSAQYGKHVYVEQLLPWLDAQRYCRYHHTDLSPLTRPWVEERLKIAMGSQSVRVWFGLYRKETQWKWSGGGDASNIRWDTGEPNSDEWAAALCWKSCSWNGWHNINPSNTYPFFCFNLIVVEKAMQHCRQNYHDLTSLVSETEHLLALSEIKPDSITERVWIGLRYLGDRWLWVNGDPLEYEAWPKGGDQDHLCPIQKRCGALTKQGQWENWDCREKLNFICY